MTIRNLGDFTGEIQKVPHRTAGLSRRPVRGLHHGQSGRHARFGRGGIGVTPMMSLIRTLADQADQRPVILLYGVRDWQSITFCEQLEALKARLKLTIVYVPQEPPVGWTGEHGFMGAEVLRRHVPPPYAEHEYFICGPGVVMDAIEKALSEMQVPMSEYHSERYSFV